jgi:DNA-binding CsgD family transcriptional regulator
LHPNDVDYLLRVYKHFVKISKSDTKRQPPQKWSTEIRVISESGCWDWVELSFDVLSYTEDNAIDKIFCTLKEEAPLHTPDRELSNVGLFAEKPDKSRVKDTLGDREIQVLHLIADGYSDKQIANKLEISIHTSVRHRKNLIEKFGVKNTAELIKEASKVFWL